jgi:hypothetical protein
MISLTFVRFMISEVVNRPDDFFGCQYYIITHNEYIEYYKYAEI